MVFKYSDDRHLDLLDFADLRAVLRHLSGEGEADLKDYGSMSPASVGVLLRPGLVGQDAVVDRSQLQRAKVEDLVQAGLLGSQRIGRGQDGGLHRATQERGQDGRIVA